jgi:hypothetical protein
LTCTAKDKVLGLRGRGQLGLNETAEANPIGVEISTVHFTESPLWPTPRVSIFDHGQQVFNDAVESLQRQSPDLGGWVIEWERLQTRGRKLYFPSIEWNHDASVSPREDDNNPVNDWSIRLAFLLTQRFDTKAHSAGFKLLKIVFEDERLTKRYLFAVRRMNDYTRTKYGPCQSPRITVLLNGIWYTGLWRKATHRLDSAIIAAKQSINTVREAVDYASQVLTSFNVFPAEPGNSSDDMQFRLFTNTLNAFDLKSKWTSFESHWERFIGQVSKLDVGTKGWPPDSASLGELLDTLRPQGFG